MRAGPRPASPEPFSSYERPKWWHDGYYALTCRLAQVDPSSPFGSSLFNISLKLAYGCDDPRITQSERVVYGIKTRAQVMGVLWEAMNKPNPFWEMLKR